MRNYVNGLCYNNTTMVSKYIHWDGVNRHKGRKISVL